MVAIENEALFFCNEVEYSIPWQLQLESELDVVIIEVSETGMVVPRNKIFTAYMVIVTVDNIRTHGLQLIEAIKTRNPNIIITIVSKPDDKSLPIEFVAKYMYMIDSVHNPNKSLDIYPQAHSYDLSLLTEKRIPLLILSSGDGVPEIIHMDKIFHNLNMADLMHYLYMSVVRSLDQSYSEYMDAVFLREFSPKLSIPGDYNLLVINLAQDYRLIAVCYLISDLISDALPAIPKLQGLIALLRERVEIDEQFVVNNMNRKILIDILRKGVETEVK